MQNNEDYINDPALGGTSTRSKATSSRKSAPKPKPTPDSVGPRTSAPKKNKKQKPENSYNLISFFRDYRTHLAVGLFLCAAAIVIAVSTVSYLFSASADQNITHGRTIAEIVASGEKVVNAGGPLGAKLAEWLTVDGFGVASFVLVFYLISLGLACMRVKRCNFFSLTFRTLFSTAALSVIIGLLTFNSPKLFHLGGNHGHYINALLLTYTDWLGTISVSALLAGLLVAVFLNPIKSMFAALASLMPERREEAVRDTQEQSPTSPLDEFEDDDTDSKEDIAEENPDDLPQTEIPEEHLRFVPPAVDVFEGKKDDSAHRSADNASSADPEMVIVKSEIDSDAAPDDADDEHIIRHGDHIGLDQPLDVRAEHSRYQFPSTELLIDRPKTFEINAEEQAANKELIVNALRSYNIEIVRIEATIGPTVTLYEIVPSQGTRISKIKSLEDDIAMSLAALGIRIIAPIPGKGTIGIEVPNGKPQIVSIRTVLESRKFRENKMALPMALGSTISNEIFMADLAKMPHLLVAGASGQGKSVGLNCIIASLIYSKHPDELKFVLIDPKMVEFSLYHSIDRQFLAKMPDETEAVITDPSKAIDTLNSLCVEMDDRYKLLQAAHVRSVEEYNDRYKARELGGGEVNHRYLPYIVMIVDEFADLIMTAGKEISQPICRIAQKARAVGMHMIIATQRPSTDIITGPIKANFPARIAFKVAQGVDSKTILDRPGAQRLIGRGDMLMLNGGIVERVQCALIETKEIEDICNHISSQPGFTACYELPEPPAPEGAEDVDTGSIKIDDEFRKCCMYIASQSTASVSSMQTEFEIGFNKARRYMNQMERLGIVGPQRGQKPRDVLMSPDQVERMLA